MNWISYAFIGIAALAVNHGMMGIQHVMSEMNDSNGKHIHIPFLTPVLHVNLDKIYSNESVKGINNQLRNVVLLNYAKYTRSAGNDDNVSNDEFYVWHMNSKNAMYLKRDEAFLKVIQAAHDLSDDLFRAIGRHDIAKERERSIASTWASVHSNGTSHDYHTHPTALLAGVYYVDVPPGSGSLKFMDRRGTFEPIWPGMEITPKSGDIILFPPWLPHGVGYSSNSQNPRISIAFNLKGRWTTTATLSLDVPTT